MPVPKERLRRKAQSSLNWRVEGLIKGVIYVRRDVLSPLCSFTGHVPEPGEEYGIVWAAGLGLESSRHVWCWGMFLSPQECVKFSTLFTPVLLFMFVYEPFGEGRDDFGSFCRSEDSELISRMTVLLSARGNLTPIFIQTCKENKMNSVRAEPAG